jgi:hypothetical protein
MRNLSRAVTRRSCPRRGLRENGTGGDVDGGGETRRTGLAHRGSGPRRGGRDAVAVPARGQARRPDHRRGPRVESRSDRAGDPWTIRGGARDPGQHRGGSNAGCALSGRRSSRTGDFLLRRRRGTRRPTGGQGRPAPRRPPRTWPVPATGAAGSPPGQERPGPRRPHGGEGRPRARARPRGTAGGTPNAGPPAGPRDRSRGCRPVSCWARRMCRPRGPNRPDGSRAVQAPALRDFSSPLHPALTCRR